MMIVGIVVFSAMTYMILQENSEHLTDHTISHVNGINSLIKDSTRYSMMLNRRDDVSHIIESIAKGTGIVESIRIYNRDGKIAFSSNKREIGKMVDWELEKCTVCHNPKNPLEILPDPDKIRPRIFNETQDYRILALNLPIYNAPSCSELQCHPSPSEQKVLGMLDTKVSLVELDENIAESRKQMILYSILGIILFEAVIGFFVWIMVHRRVKKVAEGSRQFMNGNFDIRVDVSGKDEIGELANSYNTMVSKLGLILDTVRSAVDTLVLMSKELVTVTNQIGSDSAEQAAASEEASSTSMEMAAVSKQIAQNAANVAKGAEGTLNLSQQGQKHLDRTTEKFEDINQSTKNIAESLQGLGEQSKLIGGIAQIIDEISEQTHLLSINAGIEAARAMEHGRPFGVVAQEIRRLAQNTKESTKKIEEIIEGIQSAVSKTVLQAEANEKAVIAGKQVLEETANILENIFNVTTDSTPRLKEVDHMTSQQASASEQMASAVKDVMVTATQSNIAAEGLQECVKSLDATIKQLKILMEEELAEEDTLIENNDHDLSDT